MSKNLLYSITFLIVLFAACTQNQTVYTASKAIEKTIEKREIPFEVSIDEVKHYSKDTTVLIEFDNFFTEPITFRGFPLKPIIDSLKLEGMDNLQLTFVCTDGYKPSIPLVNALHEEGYITHQGEEDLKAWPDSIRKRIPPYYVTWKTDEPNKDLINPYGVTSMRVELIGFNYDKLLPQKVKEDSLLSNGFKLYEKMCMKCHSVNKEGGDLGPELNYPQNITEYRSKEFMFAFIKNPQAFRYNSKMHSIPLSDEKLDLIYNYLEVMKGFKIAEK
ncbi:MAG: cytochrome c [Chitinophagales bacterium]